MRLLGPTQVVLAVDLFDAMRSNFRPDRDRFQAHDLLQLGIVACVVGLLLWGLSRALASQETNRRSNGPRRLFHELCQAHALDWRDRWFLWKLARAERLAFSAAVFLDPRYFNPTRLRGRLARERERCDRLAVQLFAEPPAPAPHSAESAQDTQGQTPRNSGGWADSIATQGRPGVPATGAPGGGVPNEWSHAADGLWSQFGSSPSHRDSAPRADS